MSTISLTLTATTLTAAGSPLTLTGAVTNAATVPARIVLAAFPPTAAAGAAPASAREWTVVERPLREVVAGATEQFTITVTPPTDAAAGDHLVRFIAYDADRPPEEYSDQARQLKVVVPAKSQPAPSGTPWWIWVAAAVLVIVVGVVAFLVLRPQPEPELPSPPPSTPASTTPSPTQPPSPKPTLTKIPTFKPTKVVPTLAQTKIATAKVPNQP